MDQSVGYSVLVVDNDERSLANLVKILIGWKYKVLTAHSAHNALETLREFEGFFDIIITEFHIHGMGGFEFQKCIKDEFQLPIIMISKDNRKDIISKSLKNGVALYILKPFCANDFKDIWKYASTSCNEKSILANDLRSGQGESKSENVVIQDVNSLTRLSQNDSECNRKYCKRKTLDEDNDEGGSQVPKKPKVYWNSHLHNMFLHAIRQIGVEKAVPKRILEVMNIPHLTRENVASHLQKYRLFLKKVAEKGMVEGLSQRALKSKFAESLPISMIYDIQARFLKQHDPLQQRHSYYINPFNKVVTSLIDQEGSSSTRNSYVTTHHGRSQFPYYSNLFNQVLQKNSSLGSNIGINNVQQNNNAANSALLSTYGGVHGLMTSQKCLSEGLDLKYGSRGNHNFSYVLGNCSIGSLSNSKILPQTSAYNPNNNSSGIQIHDVSLMGSSANNNSFGFINGTQNENINVTSLGNENFDLLQGGAGSQFDSNVGGNDFGVMEMPRQRLDDNVVRNEQQFINASAISEIEVNLMEEDPSELLLMLDDMGLFNDLMEENNLTASDISNVELSNSSNIVQPLYQFDSILLSNGAENVTVPQANITSNLTNVHHTLLVELEGNGVFAKEGVYDKFTGDIIGSSNTSAIEPDLDMEKIEALFGTLDD